MYKPSGFCPAGVLPEANLADPRPSGYSLNYWDCRQASCRLGTASTRTARHIGTAAAHAAMTITAPEAANIITGSCDETPNTILLSQREAAQPPNAPSTIPNITGRPAWEPAQR